MRSEIIIFNVESGWDMIFSILFTLVSKSKQRQEQLLDVLSAINKNVFPNMQIIANHSKPFYYLYFYIRPTATAQCYTN